MEYIICTACVCHVSVICTSHVYHMHVYWFYTVDANIKAVEEISAKVGEEIKILGKFTTVMNGFTIKCGEK